MERDEAADLYQAYDGTIGTIVGMINHPENVGDWGAKVIGRSAWTGGRQVAARVE
jgi:hypothetical protein